MPTLRQVLIWFIQAIAVATVINLLVMLCEMLGLRQAWIKAFGDTGLHIAGYLFILGLTIMAIALLWGIVWGLILVFKRDVEK